MSLGSDFSDAELAGIREMLRQRYQKEVEIHLADSELSLQKGGAPVICPTVFWHERNANFVVFKISAMRYRSQFFYTPHEQYGTGIDEYHDLDECVAALLQVQADHERESQGVTSGATGETLKT